MLQKAGPKAFKRIKLKYIKRISLTTDGGCQLTMVRDNQSLTKIIIFPGPSHKNGNFCKGLVNAKAVRALHTRRRRNQTL
jgi:hypothetical protein